MLSYTPHICYHHCMKYHHTYPLDICMLKYRYASASNMNPILLRRVHTLYIGPVYSLS